MKNETFTEIKYVYENVRQKLISLIDNRISPNINNRRSTLSSNALATILAHAALKDSSKKTSKWIEMNTQKMNIAGIPTPLSESSPLMLACFTILEKICGVSLPPQLREKIPPVEEIANQLDYPCSYDTSYILPLHLACAALLCTIKGVKIPQILQMVSDLQQPDGSWTDDTIITALSAIALQKEEVESKYDAQKWLKREQLPDGSWAVANGEVWEASYALRTGEVPHTSRLVAVLKEGIHPNFWWGFSRYAVPDTDSEAVACCALASYEPHVTSTVCEKLLDVQHENGGWGAFPQIAGVVPQEFVVGKPRTQSNDVTCHVLEALEQNKKSANPFKKGISYLLETQEQDGHWETMWWNSAIYATTDIALLMHRNGYTDPAFHALNWLEKKLDETLNTVEYALLIKAFSEHLEYSDSLERAVHKILKQYSSKSSIATFDGIYFAGLIDYTIYNFSIIVSSLGTFLRK